jgi:CRP-like cAMP-binding protein
MAEANLLKGFGFFSDLDASRLGALAQKCSVFECKSGDVIYRAGEAAKHLYGVLEGEVELILEVTDKELKAEIRYEEAVQASVVDKQRRVVVDAAGPGKVFGWAALSKLGRRTLTARCREAGHILSLSAVELKAMMDADHTLGYLLMKRLSDMLSVHLKIRTDKLIETWVEAFGVGKI